MCQKMCNFSGVNILDVKTSKIKIHKTKKSLKLSRTQKDANKKLMTEKTSA